MNSTPNFYDTDDEFINICTNEDVLIRLTKAHLCSTEFGRLRENNKDSFDTKSNQVIKIPFSLAAIASVLFPNKDKNDTYGLQNLECSLYFYPSSLTNLKICVDQIFEWSYNDKLLRFDQNGTNNGLLLGCKIWYTNEILIKYTLPLPDFTQTFVLNQTPIMDFLDYLEDKLSILGFPVDECRLFFASVDVSIDSCINKLPKWLKNICSRDEKSMEFSRTGLITQKWISLLDDDLLNDFATFVYSFIKTLSFPKNQRRINQRLLKHLLIAFPDTRVILWPFIEEEECFKAFIKEYHSMEKLNLNHGDFRHFLKHLFAICSEQPDFQTMLDTLAEMIVDIWKNNGPNYCVIHPFVEKTPKLKQKLINILSMRIALQPNDNLQNKKNYVMHLHKLIC